MRLLSFRGSVLAASLLPAALLVACGGGAGGIGGTGGGTPATTGGLSIQMRDCPIPGAEHVYVTIESVEVSFTDPDGNGVRETVSSVPGQYDLLALQNGVEAVLGSGQFAPGTYHWIRLNVSRDSKHDIKDLPADQLKNYIVISGTPYPLVIPSGEHAGIKLGHNFTIEAGVTTVLKLDFDVSRSIHRAGHHHHHIYTLRPRIRVVVTTVDGSEATGISGTVSTTDNTAVPMNSIVSAQQSGAQVATGTVDDQGHYSITGLADGTYDLVLVAPGDNFASESGVTVTGGSASGSHDFSTSAANVGAVIGTITPAGDNLSVSLIWSGFVVGTVSADPTTGFYMFDNLPPVAVTVSATNGTSTQTSDVTVPSGDAVTVDFGF